MKLHSSVSVICSDELFESKTHSYTFLINKKPVDSDKVSRLKTTLSYKYIYAVQSFFFDMENISDISAHKHMRTWQIHMHIHIIIIVVV